MAGLISLWRINGKPSYIYHNECPKPGNFLGLHLVLPLEKERQRRSKCGYRSSSRGNYRDGRLSGPRWPSSWPDGRKRVAQVDGGSGYRENEARTFIWVSIKSPGPVRDPLRDPDGNLHEETIHAEGRLAHHLAPAGLWQIGPKSELQ